MNLKTTVDRLAYELWITGERISAITNQPQHFLARKNKDLRARYRRIARRALLAGEPTCIRCGCTEDRACDGGCSWTFLGGVTAYWGLCSVCFEHLCEEDNNRP